MDVPNQELLPDQTLRPTDFELLQACWLVTTIPNYSCDQPYPNLKLLKIQKTLYAPPGKELPVEGPSGLKNLRDYGWELFSASHWEGEIQTQNDYQGIILINEKSQTILLVHRGMQYTNKNLSEALSIATKKVPDIALDATNMCSIALNLTRDRFHNFKIIHTGFSMGGFLAQFTSAYCNDLEENSRHNLCVCFDPPGASDAIHQCKFRCNRKNTYVYVTAPNAVNTATAHYGHVRQIFNYTDKNDYKGKLKSLCVDQPFAIDTRDSIPRFRIENADRYSTLVELGKSTLNYHDQDRLRQDLNGQLYFKFNHVQSWPLSTNRLRQPTSRRRYEPFHYSPWAALDLAVDVSNLYLARKGAGILARSELEDHYIIEHQVINPDVVLTNEPYLTDVTPELPELVLFAAGWIFAILHLAAEVKEEREHAVPVRSDSQNLAQFGLSRGNKNSNSTLEGSRKETPDANFDRKNRHSGSF